MWKKFRLIIKHSHWFLLLFVAIEIIWIPIVDSFSQMIRGSIIKVMPEYLNRKYVTFKNYYIITFLISLIICAIMFLLLCYKKFLKIPTRDVVYLKKMLESSNPNLPAMDRKDLISKITGNEDDNENKKYEEMIANYIDDNIKSIQDFLENKIENVLVLESAWGTGKTSNVIMGIDKFSEENIQANNKYIYESAFKYATGLAEFIKDIINAMNGVLALEGISISSQFKGIIDNLDSNLSKSIFSFLKENQSQVLLSSDLICEINKKYKKKKLNLSLIIILDDIDRLQGEDIIKVLSLVSLLRRLTFVKIIIPLDLKAVVSQLEQVKIYEPSKFIQKYVPEQTTIKLQSEYEMIEKVALSAIGSKLNLKYNQLEKGMPIWEAILFSVFSDKIRQRLTKNQNYHHKWLQPSSVKEREESKDWLSGEILILLNAPLYLYEHTEKIITGSKGFGEYRWYPSVTVKEFQNVIYMLQRNADNARICNNFTEEDYKKVVASWIRDFAREKWEKLGITLRDVLNTIRGLKKINMGENNAETFAKVFNEKFPQSYLNVVKDK